MELASSWLIGGMRERDGGVLSGCKTKIRFGDIEGDLCRTRRDGFFGDNWYFIMSTHGFTLILRRTAYTLKLLSFCPDLTNLVPY